MFLDNYSFRTKYNFYTKTHSFFVINFKLGIYNNDSMSYTILYHLCQNLTNQMVNSRIKIIGRYIDFSDLEWCKNVSIAKSNWKEKQEKKRFTLPKSAFNKSGNFVLLLLTSLSDRVQYFFLLRFEICWTSS